MVHGREYKLLSDLMYFINENAVKKEDIIAVNTRNDSKGAVMTPDYFFVIFHSDKTHFVEPAVKFTL